jgi:hypothetical protein
VNIENQDKDEYLPQMNPEGNEKEDPQEDQDPPLPLTLLLYNKKILPK